MRLEEGVVVDVNDPQQMGRFKVWVPAIDGELYTIDSLPWVRYVTPLAGQTRDYAAGPTAQQTNGLMSYGWWSIPKKGALVIIGFLYNDPNRRVYLGSYFRDHGNRSLPDGRHRADIAPGPLSDTFEPVQPAQDNLKKQFNGNLTAPEARSRGAYERMVAQDKTIKDGLEGYQQSVQGEELTPQTTAFTTPGRHALIFQDNPENGRIRIKTAAGHQVILDDANERIYISTAGGSTWVELDQDGRVHLYAADSVSMSSGGDVNISAAGAINMQAGGAINLQSGAAFNLAACSGLNMSGKTVNIESGGGLDILAAGTILATGSRIHLNGPTASGAACPTAPTVVPQHEPWKRATSKQKRNRNWKE